VFILLTAFSSEAQDLKQEAGQYFSLVRIGTYPSFPEVFTSAKPENEILTLLQPFLDDSVNDVREKAYEIVYAVTAKSTLPGLREGGVGMLMNAFRDHDPGVRATAIDLLAKFRKKDFNPAVKDSLRNLIRSGVAPLDKSIKFAGFLQLTDLIPLILQWSQPGNPARLRWSALQSLARMGDDNAIADMMIRVRKLPVNDDLVYNIFPDLLFTRQPGPIAWIVEALESDETNCMSADAERAVPIPCGYRIMEQLASVIEGFPLERDESGDLKADHYPSALRTVRQWFRIHKTYTIIHDRY